MKILLRIIIYMALYLHVTTSSFCQWIQTPVPSADEILCLGTSGVNLYAGTYAQGIFLSTDNGNSWIPRNSGLTNLYVKSFIENDINIIIGTSAGGVFRSSDYGANWSIANNGLPTRTVNTFFLSGTNLFAGVMEDGVFLSNNNGDNWISVNNGLPTRDRDVYAFAIRASNLFTGIEDWGVYLSSNNGESWSPVNNGLTDIDVFALAVIDENIFAGSSGVFLSSNDGASWIAINNGLPITSNRVRTLVVNGTNIFAGFLYHGVYLSTNNGNSWVDVSDGLTSKRINALLVSGTHLFAATDSSVWRRPFAEMITSVQTQKNDFPITYELNQNFPNPFNPSTTITFSLASRSFVFLKVYDALGREVSTLVSEELPAGTYSRQWLCVDFPSGVYFYRLQAGTFSETKKLAILR